jgi:hypothetical protein
MRYLIWLASTNDDCKMRCFKHVCNDDSNPKIYYMKMLEENEIWNVYSVLCLEKSYIDFF